MVEKEELRGGAVAWYGVGPIVKINEEMDRYLYLDILNNKMES